MLETGISFAEIKAVIQRFDGCCLDDPDELDAVAMAVWSLVEGEQRRLRGEAGCVPTQRDQGPRRGGPDAE